MGKGLNYCSSNKCQTKDNCICEIVKDIEKAQNKIKKDQCLSSCKQSISQIKKGQSSKDRKNKLTTIPFMLYSEGSHEPFIGVSVIKCAEEDGEGYFYECIESPVFRVNHVDCNCCATIELLLAADENGNALKRSSERQGSCSFFPFENGAKAFIRTDVCITVNLKKFVGISCLEPITPIH